MHGGVERWNGPDPLRLGPRAITVVLLLSYGVNDTFDTELQ